MRGDTLVEVLIAISIISAVLGGAYVSANRSSKAIRTAQERSEALKIAAETQMERIKVAADNNSPDIFSPGDFCLDPALNTSPPCSIVVGGVTYDTTVNHVAGSHDFAVKVIWDSLSGGKNNVELYYRTQ